MSEAEFDSEPSDLGTAKTTAATASLATAGTAVEAPAEAGFTTEGRRAMRRMPTPPPPLLRSPEPLVGVVRWGKEAEAEADTTSPARKKASSPWPWRGAWCLLASTVWMASTMPVKPAAKLLGVMSSEASTPTAAAPPAASPPFAALGTRLTAGRDGSCCWPPEDVPPLSARCGANPLRGMSRACAPYGNETVAVVVGGDTAPKRSLLPTRCCCAKYSWLLSTEVTLVL